MKFFLRKINLVQLGIIFPAKDILFLILGKNLDGASASSCLLLVLGSWPCFQRIFAKDILKSTINLVNKIPNKK